MEMLYITRESFFPLHVYSAYAMPDFATQGSSRCLYESAYTELAPTGRARVKANYSAWTDTRLPGVDDLSVAYFRTCSIQTLQHMSIRHNTSTRLDNFHMISNGDLTRSSRYNSATVLRARRRRCKILSDRKRPRQGMFVPQSSLHIGILSHFPRCHPTIPDSTSSQTHQTCLPRNKQGWTE